MQLSYSSEMSPLNASLSIVILPTISAQSHCITGTLKKTNVGSMCILHIASMHKQIIYFMLCVKCH